VGADEAERHDRIEEDDVGADVAGHGVDAARDRRCWEHEPRPDALDLESLLGVPRRGVVVRRGEHVGLARRQPSPQLVEI
jgi:hypothetical protein